MPSWLNLPSCRWWSRPGIIPPNTVTSETVIELGARWHPEPRTISCVSRGGNLVYRFESSAGRSYMRLTASDVRPLDLVAGAIDWHRHLWQAGAPVAEPVPSANGFWIEVIAGDTMPIFATVTREVRGEHVNFSSLADMAAWADAIGRIHAASEGYEPSSVSTSAGGVEGRLPTLPDLLK